MNNSTRAAWLVVLALAALIPARGAAPDCSNWTLDGYRLGMRGDEPDSVRQRRTIWWSTTCDAAIIVCEYTSLRGSTLRSVNATLARPSMLPPGLAQMKTLFP